MRLFASLTAFLPLLFLFVSWPSIAQAVIVSEPCTGSTPVGVPCQCNRWVLKGQRHHDKHPDWVPAGGMYHFKYTRPGWHVTNTRGMHNSGDVCYRDQ